MKSLQPPPPSPVHILRSHSNPLAALSFSDDNERLYSGDSLGQVVVTSTRYLRPITSWKAHTDGLLGVQEWGKCLITHGRDNKLHVWSRVEEQPSSAAIRVGGSAVLPGLSNPTLLYSMDVNALNYCRFSLLSLLLPIAPQDFAAAEEGHALIALPNLVESSFADIWELPSRQRHHAAIGKADPGTSKSTFAGDGRGINATGIIMSMHLFAAHPNTSTPRRSSAELRLLCAYENGSVTLRKFTPTDREKSIEGVGWEIVWTTKLHVETVMAMAVTMDNTLALTVSADHLVGRYDLTVAGSHETGCAAHRTKHPGNAAITVRGDGKVCAIGGWDGKIRLYSTKTMKALGVLEYHKDGCGAIAFANSLNITDKEKSDDESDDSEEMTDKEKVERCRWLAAGGKDCRVSIWALMSFGKT